MKIYTLNWMEQNHWLPCSQFTTCDFFLFAVLWVHLTSVFAPLRFLIRQQSKIPDNVSFFVLNEILLHFQFPIRFRQPNMSVVFQLMVFLGGILLLGQPIVVAASPTNKITHAKHLIEKTRSLQQPKSFASPTDTTSFALSIPSHETGSQRRRIDNFPHSTSTLESISHHDDFPERRLCSTNAQTFETSVVLMYEQEIVQGDQNQIWDEESALSALGETFLASYNEKVEELCDPFFRRVSLASARFDSVVRSPTSTTIRVHFDLQGVCNGCLEERNGGLLFGEGRLYHKKSKESKESGFSDAFEQNPNCRCRSNSPEYREPDSLEVQDAMNRAISLELSTTSKVNDDDDLFDQSSQRKILKIIEVDQLLDCMTDDETAFSTVVLVEMKGLANVMIDNSDTDRLLVSIFQYVFNELNFLACDSPSFRRIGNVQKMDLILPNDTVVLFITGVCHNCDKDIPLFTSDDKNFQIRRLWQSSRSSSTSSTTLSTPSLQQNQTARAKRTEHRDLKQQFCYCPSNTPRLLRSPTTQEFREAYEDKVASLALLEDSDDELANMPFSTTDKSTERFLAVDNILEVEIHNCSSSIQHYKSYAWVEMNQSLAMMTREDIAVIEKAFVKSYNELIALMCDIPFFRRALNASAFTFPAQKPLQSTPSTLNFQQVVQLEITVKCRNCIADKDTDSFLVHPPLFHRMDDSSSSRRGLSLQQHFGVPRGTGRILQSTDNNSIENDNDTGTTSTTVCFCPKANKGLGRTPTVDEFQQLFSTTIQDRQDTSELSSMLGTVRGIREVQGYEGCSVNITTFTSTIWVEFDRRYSNMDTSTRNSLEDLFVTTYNDLSFQACDAPLFRTVVNATLEEMEIKELRRQLRRRRRVDSLPAYFDYTRVAKLKVYGECRNCPEDSTLFDYSGNQLFPQEGERRMTTQTGERMLTVLSNIEENVYTRQMQTTSTFDTCFCGIHEEKPRDSPMPARAPTALEFQDAYQSKINDLFSDGSLNSIWSLQDLLEVDEFDCGSDTAQHETIVFVQVQGNLSSLSNQELQQWSGSFHAAHDNLNFATCDAPFFRQVINIRINEGPKLQINSFPESLSLVKMFIQTECKACMSNDSLFASRLDGTHDKLPSAFRVPTLGEVEDSGIDHVSSSCFCPANRPSEAKPPTEEQFRVAFNSTITQLQEEHSMFMDLGAVEGVLEVEEFECDGFITLFETKVYLQLDRASTMDTNEEIEELLQLFTTIYNHLNFAVCDAPAYRRIQNLTVADILPSTSNVTFTQIELFVLGECRNCPVDSKLFAISNTAVDVGLSLSQLPKLIDVDSFEDQNATTCFCPRNIPHTYDAPTIDQFLAIMNEDIASQQEMRGILQNLRGIRAIEEVQDVACLEEELNFRSAVLVDLRGNLDALTSSEITAMEESFKETYNALSFSVCDEYFRQVVAVVLIPGREVSISNRRVFEDLLPSETITERLFDRLDASNTSATRNTLNVSDDNTTDVFALPPTDSPTTSPSLNVTITLPPSFNATVVMPSVYVVEGRCRACPVTEAGTFDLFDDDGLTRRIFEAPWSSIAEQRKRQSSFSDDCICPAGLQPGDLPPPTEGEFLEEYSENIDELIEDGVIENVEEVAQETLCDEKFEELDDVFFATIVGDFFEVPEAAAIAIAGAFVEAYTSLRNEPCSPIVLAASIQMSPKSAVTTESRQTLSWEAELVATRSGGKNDELFPGLSMMMEAQEEDVYVQDFLNTWNDLLMEHKIEVLSIGQSPDPSSAPSSTPSTGPPSPPTSSPKPSVTPSLGPSLVLSPLPSTSPSQLASSSPPSLQPSVSIPKTSPTTSPSTVPTVSSESPSFTPTTSPSQGPTASFVPSVNPSAFPSLPPSDIPSVVPSSAPSEHPSFSVVPSNSPSHVPSALPSTEPSVSAAPSLLPSHLPSLEPSARPSLSFAPTAHPSRYPSALPSSDPSQSAIPSADPSLNPSIGPSEEPSLSTLPSEMPSATPSSVPSKQPTLSPSPSSEPSNQPSKKPSGRPTMHPSGFPTELPSSSVIPSSSSSAFPSSLPSTAPTYSQIPSVYPTTVPSVQPSSSPSTSTVPSLVPTSSPSDEPTHVPSVTPTSAPTVLPSAKPTSTPTIEPTKSPSTIPSTVPSGSPSDAPTMRPSGYPTSSSRSPTTSPTVAPSSLPTSLPTSSPTTSPTTDAPTMFPSVIPSDVPTTTPTDGPTRQPSALPSQSPSLLPTSHSPTVLCIPDRTELLAAVDDFVLNGEQASSALTYGSIESWCFASSLEDFSFLFSGDRNPQSMNFNGDISMWDVSSVTDMSHMFRNNTGFNGDISLWDVSSVISMRWMFGYNDVFNADISIWDVSSVTDMSGMFGHNDVFNGDISIWDVSSVKEMEYMFVSTDVFNGDISMWDVSSVTMMESVFEGNDAFNGDISMWNVSRVKEMSWMFCGCGSFNGDISMWDVSRVTAMSAMFTSCDSFDGDISQWDVSGVTDMGSMFSYNDAFNGDISMWDVSRVTRMSRMFAYNTVFNADLSLWDVSRVNNMDWMFASADAFNVDISMWDVSSVTKMKYMFAYNEGFNGNISVWDLSSVNNTRYMFYDSNGFNQSLCEWGDILIPDTNVDSMFLLADLCSNTSDPDLLANPPGPFCQPCGF